MNKDESQLPFIDPDEWEAALATANRNLSPDEEDWVSWKCDGGPHQHVGQVVINDSLARSERRVDNRGDSC